MALSSDYGEDNGRIVPDQVVNLFADAAIRRGQVRDCGFLYMVIDRGAMLPGNPFTAQMRGIAPRRPPAPAGHRYQSPPS
jgi:hypothetical protein